MAFDVSALTIAGGDYKPFALDGELSFGEEVFDGTIIGSSNAKECIRKKNAQFTTSLISTVGDCHVSGLDMSALTIDSISVLDYAQNLTFNIANNYLPVEGVSDEWVHRQFSMQTLTASVELLLPLDLSTLDNIFLDAISSTFSNNNMVLAFTINSEAFSVPMYVKNPNWSFARGQEQKWKLDFGPRGAATSPAGTATLLTKALNNPGGAAQVFNFVSKAAGGVDFDGEFFPSQVSFTVDRTDSIKTQYTYISEGAVTGAATV